VPHNADPDAKRGTYYGPTKWGDMNGDPLAYPKLPHKLRMNEDMPYKLRMRTWREEALVGHGGVGRSI